IPLNFTLTVISHSLVFIPMTITEDYVLGSYVLIIEGNSVISNSLAGLLCERGYVANTANSGAKGYSYAALRLPKLILLSTKLPDSDGFSVCRKFQATPSLAKIPVIFLGQSNCLTDFLASFNAGGVDYICFPYPPAEVLARVCIHLTKQLQKLELDDYDYDYDYAACNLNDDEVLVRAARQYFVKHLSDNPSLEQLDGALEVDAKHLARAFKRQTATTFKKFFGCERIRISQHLLAETTFSVAEIAEKAGFSRASNFATA